MSDIEAYPIESVVGWKGTDDKQCILVKLRQPNENELTLAMPVDALVGMITSLLAATAAVEHQMGQSTQHRVTVSCSWYEVGREKGSDSLLLTLYTADKGNLSFQMPRAMVERLSETLTEVLKPGSIVPPRDTSRH